jgi:hypothetical protein
MVFWTTNGRNSKKAPPRITAPIDSPMSVTLILKMRNIYRISKGFINTIKKEKKDVQ